MKQNGTITHTVSAPGKIIFFGEHAVVYDRLGLAAAVDIRTKISCSLTGSRISVDLKDYGLRIRTDRNELQELLAKVNLLIDTNDWSAVRALANDPVIPVKAVLAKAFDTLDCGKGAELNVSSAIPKASGLGSGSAIFVSIVAGLQACSGDIDKKIISEISYFGDIIAHGYFPSGIDNNTSCYGGYMKYIKREGISPIKVKKQLPIVIGNTGIQAPTAETVAHVRTLRNAHPAEIDTILDSIDSISREALNIIENKNDFVALGKLMNKNQNLLEQLEVSHPALEKLNKAALGAGALGATLSGGGGGGIMMALCADETGQAKVSESIKKAGGIPITTRMGVEGVKVTMLRR